MMISMYVCMTRTDLCIHNQLKESPSIKDFSMFFFLIKKKGLHSWRDLFPVPNFFEKNRKFENKKDTI